MERQTTDFPRPPVAYIAGKAAGGLMGWTIYFAGEPTEAIVKSEIRKAGSSVLDDFRIAKLE